MKLLLIILIVVLSGCDDDIVSVKRTRTHDAVLARPVDAADAE